MAVADPNFWMALHDSMRSLWWQHPLTSSTKFVYKRSMAKIQHTFDIDSSLAPLFNVGAYVRAVGRDNGTGMIVAVSDSDVLDEKTNKVYHQRIYHVHWLDMKNPAGDTIYGLHPEGDLSPSARSVPKFASEEEAEAWMEAQTQPGNWTAAAQDATDSASDIDVALQKMLEEGLKDD